MFGKRMSRLGVLVLAFVAGLPIAVIAAPPWAALMSGNRVEADPSKSYQLAEENGPWMILACSFSGEGADKQAHELALELRKRYKLEAYTHNFKLRLDDPNGSSTARARASSRWQYKRFKDRPDLYRDNAIKEYAVLVGNYRSVDDPEAQSTLQKIKQLEPDTLNPKDGKQVSRTLAALRYMQQIVSVPQNIEKTKRGPMGHALITRNPLLPEEYFAPKSGIDELVLKMNKHVKHSLLDCPAKYTVQVAHFTGKVVLDQRQIQEIEGGGKQMQSSLDKAAEAAHDLTEALRMKGYEAYEFHDRYMSIVTVGSFDSVGTPRQDGKTEINPKIHAIMKHFGGQDVGGDGQTGAITVKSFVGIPFDYQPIPVEVPKRSISRELAQRVRDD